MKTFNYDETENINKVFKGRKIVKTSTQLNKQGDLIGTLELDNFTKINIIGNIGCSYSSDGWYAIETISTIDSYISTIEISQEEITNQGKKYSLKTYTNGKPTGIAFTLVGTDGDNSHGTGFTLEIEPTI